MRPANSQNVEAIDQTIRLLSESLNRARKPDEKRVVEAVFAALRAAKGARQHLNLLPACTGGHDVAEYNVILKDANGSDTASDLIEGLPAVKKRARRLFSNEFAQFLGTTHECI
ncbi:hypothetical protein ACN6KF_006693 [Labrys sp. La1]|uniref:hypothetical protein n=1 Tax=Labrys sp. La1 TaxID=3404917 RepID=UPI003EB96518